MRKNKVLGGSIVAQSTEWRNNGNHLVVCMDANENVYKKSIGEALTDVDGLSMREVLGDHTMGYRLKQPTFVARLRLIQCGPPQMCRL